MSLQQADSLVSHNCYGGTTQTANTYGMTRENMPMTINKGAEINRKSVTNQVFTVLVLLVELGTDIEK